MSLNKIRQIIPMDRSLLLKCTHHLIIPIARGLSLRLKHNLITLADSNLLRLKHHLITPKNKSLLLQFKHNLIRLTRTYPSKVVIGISVMFFIGLAGATSPSSFSKAKNIMLHKIYFDNQKTFYCGCAYKDKVVDLNSCGYVVRNNKHRAKRIEAEHIVPAYHIANLTEQGRQCWSRATQLQGTNGREHCLKTNKQFKQAHNDLINLVPVIGEINFDRSNYGFAMIKGEIRNYGACDIEINHSGNRDSRTVEPAPHIRGDIARIYLYMTAKYGLGLSQQTRQLMKIWNRFDPIDAWEQKRVNRIVAIQSTQGT